MPIFEPWYKRKPPIFQIKVLKCIAIHGELSKKKITGLLGAKAHYPDVSDAVKVLNMKELIVRSHPDFHSPRPEQYYKVTGKGLGACIQQNPSSHDFWNAVIWFCKLSKKKVDRVMFERYYDRFEQDKIGNSSIRGGYFQLYFLDRILDDWLKKTKLGKYSAGEPRTVPLSQKILECLALNRAITLDQLVEEIRRVDGENFRTIFPDKDFDSSPLAASISYERIKKVLNDFVQTAADYFSNIYLPNADLDDTDKLDERYLDFVGHLIIVSKEQPFENGGIIRYEMSLFGVILILSIIRRLYTWTSTSRYFQNNFLHSRMGLYDFYDKVAANYHDKLPLIFGKWDLLKKKSHGMLIEPYFNVILFDDIRSDVMKVPNLMGGNKEIYENIHALALYTDNKLLEIYNEALSVLEEHTNDKQSIKRKYSTLVNKKLTEIEALIKYADLKIFAKDLQQKKYKLRFRNVGLKDLSIAYRRELSTLEQIFREEITFLFYSNLSKEKENYFLEFHPLHSLFLSHKKKDASVVSSIVPPRSTLLSILHSDNEVKVWFSNRVRDSLTYQKKTLDGMCDLYATITGENPDVCKKMD
jgi:hypothetical protein